jgi:PAS domain S-box-containing protein
MKILHLEDDPAATQRVAGALTAAGLNPEIVRVQTRADFEAALGDAQARGGLDLILARHMLRDLPGPEALALAQARCPGVPFIFLAIAVPQGQLVQVLRQGATDYVLKSDLDRLPVAVERALRENEERLARQRAEAEAAVERERLRVTLASIGDAVIATDTRGQVSFMNPAAETLTGWPLREVVGAPIESVFVIVNEATRQPVESPAARVLRDGAITGLANHTLLQRRDGSHVPIDDSGAPIFDQDGRLIGAVLVFRDISRRRAAEQAIRDSEARFQILADTTPVLVWMARPDGSVEFVNETWLAFTGRSLEQELGDGWVADVHAADLERCLATYRAAVSRRQPFQQEYRLRRRDGQYRWLLDTGVPRFEDHGRFAGFIGSLSDIQERKEFEATLSNRAAQQAELANLGQRALAGMALPELFDEVTRVVSRTLGAQFCEVLELEPGGQTLRLTAGQGWQPGRVGAETVSSGGRSMAGFTLLSDEPVVVDDLARETRFQPPALLSEHAVVSGVTSIIRGGDGPWGVLGVFTPERREFGPDDANFLQSVANVLADAIVRTRVENALRVAHDQNVAILQGVAEGVTVQGRDSQLVFANDAAARLLGYPSAEKLLAAGQSEILGKYEIFDEAGKPVTADRLPGRRALRGERDAELTVRFHVRATGEERWAHDHAQPVFNHLGEVELAVSIFHDITELKQAEINQSLLANAGELLVRDLDTEALLQGLARLPVPHLADYTIIYQLDPDMGVRATGHYHADPAQAAALAAFVEYTQTNRNPDSPVRQALSRREPVMMAEIDVDAAAKNLAPEIQHLAHLVPHSLLLVPLVARERLSGVLLLARIVTRRPYASSDQDLALELARRAALALDNSQLFGETKRHNAELEERVRERTEALNAALEQLQRNNEELATEIAERQEAEDRFRNLLQAAPDATIMVNDNGIILMANQHAQVVFGYTPDELLGEHVELLLPKAMAARHRGHRRGYMRAPKNRMMGERLDIVGRRKDGSEFPAEVSLSPLQTPEGLLVTASVRDVTERKLAEEALQRSERQLAQAQQIARVGSWRWEVAADRLAWSDVLWEIHGFEPPAPRMTYAEFLEYIHPDDRSRVNGIIGAARRAASPFEYEHRILRADGAARTLYSRGEVLRDAAGEAQVISAITQDLTEQKAIEEELRSSREQLRQLSSHLQAAREEERTRMSREIHDELGGTLTALKMDVARLAKNAETLTPAELRERAATMSAMLDNSVHTVRRIASDLRPGILDDFGLAAAIDWQLQEFGERAGLEFDYDANTEDFNLDPASSTALFRLFQEMLTNVARHAQATRVSVRVESTPDELVLEVRDNGRGISDNEIVNAKSLGLLGMRERVHLLGGQLSITGQPGRGTTVLVRVPLKLNSPALGELQRE